MRLILLWLILSVAAVQAQGTTGYVAADRSVRIEYPAGWTLDEDPQTDFIYLRSGDVNLTFYTPAVLDAYLIGNIAAPDILVGLVMALNDLTPLDLQEGRIGGRAAAVYAYANPRENTSGLLTAIQFRDGRLGLVDAYRTGGDIATQRAEIDRIIGTFDVPPPPAPAEVTNADGEWTPIIDALRASGILGGGQLVFVQPGAFTAGTGERFQALAQQSRDQNVVVGGTLIFTPGSGTATCGLTLRHSDTGAYLFAGFDAAGQFQIREGLDTVLAQADLGLTNGQPQSVIVLALGPRLVVYVNGTLLFDDLRVTEQAGYYGILLNSAASGRCEVRNMWAYRLSDVPAAPGVCQVVANSGAVNKRQGPGVSFEIAGQLALNAAQTVVGLDVGEDGLRWWQLDDESWVREDVVSEQGDCSALAQQPE